MIIEYFAPNLNKIILIYFFYCSFKYFSFFLKSNMKDTLKNLKLLHIDLLVQF